VQCPVPEPIRRSQVDRPPAIGVGQAVQDRFAELNERRLQRFATVRDLRRQIQGLAHPTGALGDGGGQHSLLAIEQRIEVAL
jgi:hypothetical protein